MTGQTPEPLRVTVWNEGRHERDEEHVYRLYPGGLHGAVAEAIREGAPRPVRVRTATLDQPEHGLTPEVLDGTDVLTWWGHVAHDEVADEIVDRVHQRVLAGMGLVVLHSGHFSKVFTRLMGTTCSLRWRAGRDRELVWTLDPSHPIAAGIPNPIVLDQHEMYGESFDIPRPDELVFVSAFSGGEVFRGGCTFRRGHGRIFYFSPGDQDYPVYHHPAIRQVIANGVAWAALTRLDRSPPAASHAETGWFEG